MCAPGIKRSLTILQFWVLKARAAWKNELELLFLVFLFSFVLFFFFR